MACNGACNRIVLDYAACNVHVTEHVMHVIKGAACNAPCNRCNYTVFTEHYVLPITLHALQDHYMHVIDM